MRTSTFRLHDIAFGGGLERTLREWRDRGMSYDEITHQLRKRGTVVSRTTVYRWVQELDTLHVEPSRPVESAFERELRESREADARG